MKRVECWIILDSNEKWVGSAALTWSEANEVTARLNESCTEIATHRVAHMREVASDDEVARQCDKLAQRDEVLRVATQLYTTERTRDTGGYGYEMAHAAEDAKSLIKAVDEACDDEDEKQELK